MAATIELLSKAPEVLGHSVLTQTQNCNYQLPTPLMHGGIIDRL